MNDPASREDLGREETIFNAAVQLRDASKRAIYLDLACENDPGLRARIERLLANDAADIFFAQPLAKSSVLASISISPDAKAAASQSPGPQPEGERIGRYKLIQRIGEGGCGVVYMAEQEEPVRRRVALKVIKLGMDTRQVIARFEAERQALALMDHANIAKVLDAGATETGRPYFVMELVGGIKITDYCEQNNLTTRQRLDLFIQVCLAVQHAHQKGVIHRDIKPSNVLVATQDGVALPKVIDFGIAKATQGRLTDQTAFTAFEQFLGTPAYMSPEQAQVGGLDVDTRSDIYSLGVLLYELLTGKTPFDAKELLAAGLEAMRRTIQAKEPPTPSTRLKQELVAQRIHSSGESKIKNQKSKIANDLDWIVMKCLEKDRARRYETANGLARDIERHLTNKPVMAGPPSRIYRFRKLVRRNKVAATAIGVVAMALMLGVVGTTWQAVRATKAEAAAKQRLSESEALSEFLRGVFQSPDPARDGRTITVAETLDTAQKNLERDLAAESGRRAQLQSILGLTYYALGLYREAIGLEEKVRDYQLAVSGLEHPNTLGALHNLANAYAAVDRRDEALKLREQVLALRRKVNGPEHADTLRAIESLANSYADAGRWDEALRLREQLLPLRRKVLGPEHRESLQAIQGLATSYYFTGRRDEALKVQEELLRLSRAVNGPEHPDTLTAMNDLAVSYGETDRRDEALKLREQVLLLRRKVLGPEHTDTLGAMNNLAHSYADVGRREEALKMREDVLVLRRKVNGPKHPDTLRAISNLGDSYLEMGRQAEGFRLAEQALALHREVDGPEHPNTLAEMHNLGVSYMGVGRWDDALKLQEQVLPLFRKVHGPEHFATLEAMNSLASCYAEAGRWGEALELREQVLPLCRKVNGPTGISPFN